MGSLVTAILLALLALTPAPVHDGQVAALRAVVDDSVPYVCVALNSGTLPAPATRDAHLESTKGRQDPPPSLLAGLNGALPPDFVAASECTQTKGEWDIIHRATGKPALLVVVGQVEIVTPTHVRVVTYTTSGFLTDTHTLFDVEEEDGIWRVTVSAIILQA